MPIDALNESMISMGVVPSSALAATCADCIVADSRADRLMQTIALAPSSLRRRNVSSNAPTDGAAVERPDLARDRDERLLRGVERVVGIAENSPTNGVH